MPPAAIELRGLTKWYGSKAALAGLDLVIQRGEIFVLLGPNGAGKTTTIRILTGLLHATAGTAEVLGHDVTVDGQSARAHMAYIPDEPYLYDRLSAVEFLAFVGELYGVSKESMAARIPILAEEFGFAEYQHELCGGYSHGMRQRVVFAAALLHDPQVLVVDEPMVGLDPRSARIVKDRLRRLAGDGVSILMSTHTLPVAEELASRIGILHHGRLVTEGALAEIRRELGHHAELEDIFLRLTEEGPAEPAAPDALGVLE